MDIEEILGTLREQIGSLKEIEKERYSNPEKYIRKYNGLRKRRNSHWMSLRRKSRN